MRPLLLGMAVIALAGCGGGSTSSPIGAGPESAPPAPNAIDVVWREGGVVWRVADPDGAHWPRSVPGAPLDATGARSCGSVVVSHLTSLEPEAPKLPASVPREQAVAAAARWCQRLAGTGNEWSIASAVLDELG
jgi:hypothetical protein